MNAWLANLPWIDRDDADVDAYVARLRKRPNYDLAAKLKAWRDDGIVTFENVVAHADIDATLADIEFFRQRYNEFKIPIEIRGRQLESDQADSFPLDEPGVKINQLHCFSRAAARLSLTSEVVDFLSHIFASEAAVAQSLTFWRGSQQPAHIDYAYVCQQKRLAYLAASWVPLEDVHPHSGPLGYYPGGHRVENSGFFDWGGGDILYKSETATRSPMDFAHYLWGRMEAQGLKRVDYCPKKGDVLIWHGNLPHEGTPLVDEKLTRKSYVTHFTSLPDLPEWMRQPMAEMRGLGVFNNGGYAFEYPWLSGRRKLPSW
ncbi:MAG: phytanoyl-CoA dioxygenase family protein [Terricaulis sp.]